MIQGDSSRIEITTTCLHPQSACSMTGGYEKVALPELWYTTEDRK